MEDRYDFESLNIMIMGLIRKRVDGMANGLMMRASHAWYSCLLWEGLRPNSKLYMNECE